ncbi:hypothetical protein PCASD_21010 [Puccinia coronata f. sp. avenae]|uniref:Uncharacterized protein n=1 Tax=Puccinia coronata f. sp. avenae TaxID=200324 RepID=A0A2N5TQ39_9BASI|nr:hypothetical protein PCASD_21010 [Puccinia coronata f. sp. avenae]
MDRKRRENDWGLNRKDWPRRTEAADVWNPANKSRVAACYSRKFAWEAMLVGAQLRKVRLRQKLKLDKDDSLDKIRLENSTQQHRQRTCCILCVGLYSPLVTTA